MRTPVYVVGTDLSARSKAALAAAAELAQRTGAEVHVLCAVHPDLVRADAEFAERVRSSSAALLRRAGLPQAVTRVVASADPAATLANHARAVSADLVAVAPRGRSAWRRALLGSVTERLLRTVPGALLIVRGPLPPAGGIALVAIDMTPGSARAFRTALDLARRLHLRLVALHVVRPAWSTLALDADMFDTREQTRESERVAEADGRFRKFVAGFDTSGVDVAVQLAEGHAVDAVLREGRTVGARLLIVGSHGKTAAHELFVGSVAHGVATHANVSVLVVRARPPARGGGKARRRTARS